MTIQDALVEATSGTAGAGCSYDSDSTWDRVSIDSHDNDDDQQHQGPINESAEDTPRACTTPRPESQAERRLCETPFKFNSNLPPPKSLSTTTTTTPPQSECLDNISGAPVELEPKRPNGETTQTVSEQTEANNNQPGDLEADRNRLSVYENVQPVGHQAKLDNKRQNVNAIGHDEFGLLEHGDLVQVQAIPKLNDDPSEAEVPTVKSPRPKLVAMTSIIQDPEDELMMTATAAKPRPIQQMLARRRDSNSSLLASNGDYNSDTDSSLASLTNVRHRLQRRFERSERPTSSRPAAATRRVDGLQPQKVATSLIPEPNLVSNQGQQVQLVEPPRLSRKASGDSFVKRLARNFDRVAGESSRPSTSSGGSGVVGKQPGEQRYSNMRLAALTGGSSLSKGSSFEEDPKSESIWYDAKSIESLDGLDEAEVADFLRTFEANNQQQQQQVIPTTPSSVTSTSTAADLYVTVTEGINHNHNHNDSNTDNELGIASDNDELDDATLNDDNSSLADFEDLEDQLLEQQQQQQQHLQQPVQLEETDLDAVLRESGQSKVT